VCREWITMTVVVGVDYSKGSRAALRLAAQEARWRQTPLVAVSAYEPPLGTAVGGYPAAAMHTEGEQKATAESELRATVEAHGWEEFANWHLGIDDEASEHTKGRYKYPYGDFEKVHRCGVLSAEVRAGRNKHLDIEDAAIRLRDMMDEMSRAG
jgi:nucleotide-binding universal stress UspA family protein